MALSFLLIVSAPPFLLVNDYEMHSLPTVSLLSVPFLHISRTSLHSHYASWFHVTSRNIREMGSVCQASATFMI